MISKISKFSSKKWRLKVQFFLCCWTIVRSALMAQYDLFRLPSTTTSISSTAGLSGQPTLDIDSPQASRPEFVSRGVRFQNGKYLKFSSHFDNLGAAEFSVNVWILRNNKTVHDFIQVGHNYTNSGEANGVATLTMSGRANEDIEYFIDGAKAAGDSADFVYDEWVLFGFGWNENSAYLKCISTSGDCEGNDVETFTKTSFADLSDFFLGCKGSLCDADSEYIIHSIKVYSDRLPGIASNFYLAPTNDWYNNPCGDSFRTGSEQCDDGNFIDGDGCDALCLQELGYTCAGGSASSSDICSNICGDGIVPTPVTGYCDDGGLFSGDGCSSSCAVEEGWECTPGDSGTASICKDICGDGRVVNGVLGYCDDGNLVSGDGCDASCAVETGAVCTSGSVSSKSVCSDICGDGIIALNNLSSAYCDDGNTDYEDGCSGVCATESGYMCEGGSLTTKSVCRTCSLSNCVKCVVEDFDKCETCVDGFNLSEDHLCVKPLEKFPEAVTSTSTAALGILTLLAVVRSVLSYTSPNALWAIANQLQLFLLLILTKTSMPDEVIDYITRNDFVSFSFNFINLESLPGLNVLPDLLEHDQDILSLSQIGLESGSAFNNNYSLLLTLFCLIPLHLGSYLLPKCKERPSARFRFRSCFGKFQSSVYELFHFTIYLRLTLEAYQFLLLSSISEISRFKFSESISFFISCVFLILCLLFLIFSYYMYSSMKNGGGEANYYCIEIIRGIKDTKGARLYTFFLLLRRLLFVTWLVCMREQNKYYLIGFICIGQVGYLTRVIWSRPFEEVKDNLIEITNEIFFIVICFTLLYLNTEEAWRGGNENKFVFIMIMNNFVLVLITTIDSIKELITILKKKSSKTKPAPNPLHIPQKTMIRITARPLTKPSPKDAPPLFKIPSQNFSITNNDFTPQKSFSKESLKKENFGNSLPLSPLSVGAKGGSVVNESFYKEREEVMDKTIEGLNPQISSKPVFKSKLMERRKALEDMKQ